MELVLGVLILLGVFVWLVIHFSRGIGAPRRPVDDVPPVNRDILRA